MSLDFAIQHTAGNFNLDVRTQLGNGLTALIGPSGSGKTTVLNVIAGLVKPKHAVITLDNETLADTGARIWIPTHRRRVGYVFQEPRLLPHLTIQQNLMFGRWFRRHLDGGMPMEEITKLLNLSQLLHRYPSKLSGGEKQRVALGRALLSHPRLLLLDEPLASVDQTHRAEILPYLDKLRSDHSIPAIYVTHTWAEVSGRADHVVELHDGRMKRSTDRT
jgi:molybdate transport system ATP-binding protein